MSLEKRPAVAVKERAEVAGQMQPVVSGSIPSIGERPTLMGIPN
jgi:hypothetical protein